MAHPRHPSLYASHITQVKSETKKLFLFENSLQRHFVSNCFKLTQKRNLFLYVLKIKVCHKCHISITILIASLRGICDQYTSADLGMSLDSKSADKEL